MVVDYSVEEQMKFYNRMSAARWKIRKTDFPERIKARMDFSIDINLKLYEMAKLDYIQHQIQLKGNRHSIEGLLAQLSH